MTRTSLAAVLGCLLAAGGAAAQKVALARADVRLGHQFSGINGFRELPDGRVLVADGIDNVVLRVDLAANRIDTLGRSGPGPGEYKSPDALFPLANGATLLVDLGNARMLVFDGSGKYKESVPIAQGQPGNGPVPLIFPRATDRQGRIYYQPVGGGIGASPDSGVVVRWDRAAGKFDTVARVKLPPVVTRSSGTASNRNVRQMPRPYPMQDSWTVTPDGQIALVRAPTYRIDWVGANGGLAVGKPIAASPVTIREPEKKEYLSEQAANGLSVSVENVNGQVSMRFARGRSGDGDDEPDTSGLEWPAVKPPVTGVNVPAADGTVWVERSVAAGTARTYDVIGPGGAVVRQVSLPVGRRLVAVGTRGVYARHVDGDGISYLERYSLK